MGAVATAVPGYMNDAVAAKIADKPKPNIIFILADGAGISNVSCYGADNFKTPNIDQLAKNGLRFSNFYAMTQCAPSRTVTLTGRYPFRTGMTVNNIKPPVDPKKEVPLPVIMKQAGYVTASDRSLLRNDAI